MNNEENNELSLFQDEREFDEIEDMEEESFEDEDVDYEQILKDIAFEVLLENPGSDRDDWEQKLIHECGSEVVDCYGNNPHEVYSELHDLWESEYYDHKTGLFMDYQEWALAFATEQATSLYHELVYLREKLDL
ncbi:MAG: hypothetical protein HUK18_00845 [Bacteroidales bacterium]|nr:hypothetical protein [Bacteroidales bacterium]